MSGRDDDFRVRPDRIRSTRPAKVKPFLNRALAAAQKAGGLKRGSSGASRSSFGRGRAASLRAHRGLTSTARRVTVKARIVRQGVKPGALAAHVAYLERDGTTRAGQPGRLFDEAEDAADGRAFAERCEDDRHHFRFIVAPEDAAELADLRDYTRDLMTDMERDLGSKLDWVAVDHWNTGHPHVHILVRGRGEDGRDLVIARDYISHGMRDRAAALVTEELGPRSERDIQRQIAREIDAERWTPLDRALAREASGRDGIVDLRRRSGATPDPLAQEKIARLRKLERLGLAAGDGAGRFRLSADAEAQLRALGERGDIIRRMQRAVTRGGRDADPTGFVLEGERSAAVLGRLAARGLDDELKGSAYAVVEGVDGRTHHLRLPDLNAASDGPIGSVVELRRYEDTKGRERIALAVRSDLTVEAQVGAPGATWLDRQLIARTPAPLGGGGFGDALRDALDRRIEHLAREGLARREGSRVLFARDLIATLRGREVEAVARKFEEETGRPWQPVKDGDPVGGVYRQRLTLASGRFAMLDDGLGFQLVPWSPSLDKKLGQQVGGIATPGGGIDWSFGRSRGIGL